MLSAAIYIEFDGYLGEVLAATRRARSVFLDPFGGDCGRKVARSVRVDSSGSLRAQFRGEYEHSYQGKRPWKKTKAFGEKPAPRSTLNRSGRYWSAWSGGPGATTKITSRMIELGINTEDFPQALVHQKRGTTTVRAKSSNRDERGRLKMQVVLYAMTGIWFTEGFLLSRGFVIEPRSLSLNEDIERDVKHLIYTEAKKAFEK